MCPFNTGDCLIEVTTLTDLTVYLHCIFSDLHFLQQELCQSLQMVLWHWTSTEK